MLYVVLPAGQPIQLQIWNSTVRRREHVLLLLPVLDLRYEQYLGDLNEVELTCNVQVITVQGYDGVMSNQYATPPMTISKH